MKHLLLLLVLSCGSLHETLAQGRQPWMLDAWAGPTAAPVSGTNLVVLHRPDSARTALMDLARVLAQQGFDVDVLTRDAVQAGRTLPDSLHLKGGAVVRITARTAHDFPATLVLHAEGIPNLRRLRRLSHGHKVRYPHVVGTNGGQPKQLPQIGFNTLVAILTAYPSVRVQYLTTP